jgi:hypothetical protein
MLGNRALSFFFVFARRLCCCLCSSIVIPSEERDLQFRFQSSYRWSPAGSFEFSTTVSILLHSNGPKLCATLVRFYMLTNMTLSAAASANRRNETAPPAVLIYCSVIKTSAKSPEFNNMQFSNRRQMGSWRSRRPASSGRFAVADHFLVIFSHTTHHSSLATSVNLGFSSRRMLLCLRQPNEASTPRAPK